MTTFGKINSNELRLRIQSDDFYNLKREQDGHSHHIWLGRRCNINYGKNAEAEKLIFGIEFDKA